MLGNNKLAMPHSAGNQLLQLKPEDKVIVESSANPGGTVLGEGDPRIAHILHVAAICNTFSVVLSTYSEINFRPNKGSFRAHRNVDSILKGEQAVNTQS